LGEKRKREEQRGRTNGRFSGPTGRKEKAKWEEKEGWEFRRKIGKMRKKVGEVFPLT